MTDPERQSSFTRQLAIAVVIALIVGSSAPWWWRDFTGLIWNGGGDDVGSEISLRLDPSLSAHLWDSPGRQPEFLDTGLDAYRAGASHTIDMPPAGKSTSVFSFDLEPIRGKKISSARLDLDPSNVVGDPFRDYSPLMVREITIGNLSQILRAEPRQVIARLTDSPTAPFDVTDSVRNALRNGRKYFQVRIQFDGLFMANLEVALRMTDAYVQWDTGAKLAVSIEP